MMKSVTAKAVTAIGTAALALGALIFSPSTAPAAKEEAPIAIVLHQPLAKDDRLPTLAKGTACSSRGWPHYEQRCQFDLRRPAQAAQAVRIIALR
jgi:hypothetical protein